MIQQIFNGFQALALSHLMVKSFEYGDSFQIQKTGETQYPNVFLEYPFSIGYTPRVGSKTVTFAFYVTEIPLEGYSDDIALLNKVEEINDNILQRMDLKTFSWFQEVVSISSITLDEWMGDNCVSIRTEITLRVDRRGNDCENPFS